MRYDIADQQCLTVLKDVKDDATSLDSPQANVKTAIDAAARVARSSGVSGCLNTCKNEFEREVTSLKNLYESAVAGGTYAVMLYQGADEEMAMQAAQDSTKMPRSDLAGGPGRMRQLAV